MYPDPKSLRKQLKATLKVLMKEHECWTLEENLGTKPKVIIQLPGTMIPDKKEYAANVKELWKSGDLISARAKFFTCSKCRWTSSGLGCEECNPEKHEQLVKQKIQQKEKLKIAIAAAREAEGDFFLISFLACSVALCYISKIFQFT
jgi:hypothetical protein